MILVKIILKWISRVPISSASCWWMNKRCYEAGSQHGTWTQGFPLLIGETLQSCLLYNGGGDNYTSNIRRSQTYHPLFRRYDMNSSDHPHQRRQDLLRRVQTVFRSSSLSYPLTAARCSVAPIFRQNHSFVVSASLTPMARLSDTPVNHKHFKFNPTSDSWGILSTLP